ncbi:MAG: CehA/McbA family metallohydrolase [archaeon]|nr:CehA/McbA family metallohydrolase [archaeon]
MKADLHIHSTYSDDSWQTPEDIVAGAVDCGLGCVAITDHNSFEAFFRIKSDDIIIVPAEEISSNSGHILAYGINRKIEGHMSIIDTINAIHEAGGVAIAAHPYRIRTGLGKKNIVSEFDGIEALNARSTKSANLKSKKLAEGFGKIITAGSDAHRCTSIGKGYLEIPDSCKTWQDVIQAIKDGKTRAFSSNCGFIGGLKYMTEALLCWFRRGFHSV